jgi:hypothetical protein
MAAGSYNFTIEQGASFGLVFTYADASGNPINLTDYSCARMQWDANNNNTYQFTTNNTNSGLYLFELASPKSSGIINFKLPASITAGYSFTSAVYDLELEATGEFYPGGGPQVIRLLEGSVTVVPEITKITCSGV